MGKASSVEIRFHESQMIVSPAINAINRPPSEGAMATEIDAALDQPRDDMVTDLVMDLGQVTWISSAGLNELIRLQARSRASGMSFRLRGLTESVQDVIRITRLERVFSIESSCDDTSASNRPDGSERLESAATL